MLSKCLQRNGCLVTKASIKGHSGSLAHCIVAAHTHFIHTPACSTARPSLTCLGPFDTLTAMYWTHHGRKAKLHEVSRTSGHAKSVTGCKHHAKGSKHSTTICHHLDRARSGKSSVTCALQCPSRHQKAYTPAQEGLLTDAAASRIASVSTAKLLYKARGCCGG